MDYRNQVYVTSIPLLSFRDFKILYFNLKRWRRRVCTWHGNLKCSPRKKAMISAIVAKTATRKKLDAPNPTENLIGLSFLKLKFVLFSTLDYLAYCYWLQSNLTKVVFSIFLNTFSAQTQVLKAFRIFKLCYGSFAPLKFVDSSSLKRLNLKKFES